MTRSSNGNDKIMVARVDLCNSIMDIKADTPLDTEGLQFGVANLLEIIRYEVPHLEFGGRVRREMDALNNEVVEGYAAEAKVQERQVQVWRLVHAVLCKTIDAHRALCFENGSIFEKFREKLTEVPTSFFRVEVTRVEHRGHESSLKAVEGVLLGGAAPQNPPSSEVLEARLEPHRPLLHLLVGSIDNALLNGCCGSITLQATIPIPKIVVKELEERYRTYHVDVEGKHLAVSFNKHDRHERLRELRQS